MKVTILGAGTAIPTKDNSPAGLYVRAGKEHLLFDAGPGTLQRLHAIGVSPFQLDCVFLTHVHVDHCLELVTLLFAFRIPQPIRTKPLTVYGPRGLTVLVRKLNQAFHGWLASKTYRLILKELDDDAVQLPWGRVQTKPMRHSTPAVGYRLTTQSKRIASSGDPDVCEAVVELGRDTDLLILECSHPDERKVIWHLTPSECGRLAASAGCRHLVLTHFYPVFRGYDIRRRVRRTFRGRLTLARDFTAFHL